MLSVFRVAEARPSGLALIAGDRYFTFAELASRVEDAARSLGSRGILAAGGPPVALVARPTLPSLEVLLALVAYGVPVLLLHPRLPAAEREQLAARVKAQTLLMPDELPLAATGGATPPLPTELDPLMPLAIVPTSGTTGTPKLSMLSRRACAASAQASGESIELGAEDRWLLCLPLAHVGGFSIVIRSLLAGSTVVAFDAGDGGLLSRLSLLSRSLGRHRVSIASFVPPILDALLRLEPAWSPEACLRAVLLGGAATSPALLERATARGVPIRTTYGLTEACSQVTASVAQAPPRVRDSGVSSGRVLSSVELSIRADARIMLRGASLFSGYFGEPNPFDADGWFVTQDLGQLEPDGELFVLGRAGELIITGGENVDPRRVEAALERDPSVEIAVVFGVRDERFGQLVACALVSTDALDLEALAKRLVAELAPHELPRCVASGIPLRLLPNGKTDRAAIRQSAAAALLPWLWRA